MLRCALRRAPLGVEATTALKLLIELVYDPGCPHVDQARAVLTRALQEADVPAVWTEWDTDDPGCPGNRKAYGSPTILVNGKDVAPGPHQWAPREAPTGPRCRIYRDGSNVLGAPPLSSVRAAVDTAMAPPAV